MSNTNQLLILLIEVILRTYDGKAITYDLRNRLHQIIEDESKK